jgi:hypothetical protein
MKNSEMNSNNNNTYLLHDVPKQWSDEDIDFEIECTLCIQQCELAEPEEHELCRFTGKCRSCPYQRFSI